MADSQADLIGDFDILPQTAPNMTATKYETQEILTLAMQNNPVIEQKRIAIEITDINIDVARNQRMPRLDLIASAQSNALARGYGDANEDLRSGDFVGYAIGLAFEYPLGNRQRQAELRRRTLERSRAVSDLQNVADQVATQTKEGVRAVQTNFDEIQVQKDATLAATAHLQSLEDTEQIREKLTPEFLLVKLQAQQDLATARQAESRAIAGYNVALARLAQTTGTVLQLHHIQNALPAIIAAENN